VLARRLELRSCLASPLALGLGLVLTAMHPRVGAVVALVSLCLSRLPTSLHGAALRDGGQEWNDHRGIQPRCLITELGVRGLERAELLVGLGQEHQEVRNRWPFVVLD
jgi:hypothetical protein